MGELRTLNAIGHELMTTLELGTLFSTIDRECCKVFEAELCQIAMDSPTAGSDAWEAQRNDRDALLVRVEKAELAARAASRQASEDDIPDMMRRLDDVDHRAERARTLH